MLKDAMALCDILRPVVSGWNSDPDRKSDGLRADYKHVGYCYSDPFRKGDSFAPAFGTIPRDGVNLSVSDTLSGKQVHRLLPTDVLQAESPEDFVRNEIRLMIRELSSTPERRPS